MKHLIISKINELSTLFIGFLFCGLLLTMRIKITGSFHYLFLVWNLFLAFIPYGITFMVRSQKKWTYKSWMLLPIFSFWLVFLPNTPYLITDLQHLQHASQKMVWYDTLLLFSFAAYGLFIMTLTIQDMQIILSKKIANKWSLLVLISIFVLCGFGIYLGRFLRWNSWDIIQNPLALIEDIIMRIRHPFTYAKTWIVTFGYAAITGLFYHVIRFSNLVKE
ncbi:DUF1361 domain-containing protein [uncultured Dokdonia sp.]|uniref:DUF1361 domain-containing protein n=1 Tax=uncultured Dokdonia sp. TaxID=575653 RepID=UPI00262167F4|nr:DUF1361 domain-containing protein [uncultured Dokdonia sp.]